MKNPAIACKAGSFSAQSDPSDLRGFGIFNGDLEVHALVIDDMFACGILLIVDGDRVFAIFQDLQFVAVIGHLHQVIDRQGHINLALNPGDIQDFDIVDRIGQIIARQAVACCIPAAQFQRISAAATIKSGIQPL